MSSKSCPHCGKQGKFYETTLKTYYKCPAGHIFDENRTSIGGAVNAGRKVGQGAVIFSLLAVAFDWVTKKR
jgi:uncharacterized protein (DUF983 family)